MKDVSACSSAWACVLSGCLMAVVAALQAAPRQPIDNSGRAATLSDDREVLDRYCVTCHNSRLRTAGLTLDQMDVEQIRRVPEGWEKVVRKLRSGAIPPVGAPRPDKTTYDRLASSLEAALDTRFIGSIASSIQTRSVIFWRSKLTAGPCCRPTIQATASTTSRTFFPFLQACSNGTCLQRRKLAALP